MTFSTDILATSIVSKQIGSRTKGRDGNESISPSSAIVILGAVLGLLLLLCIAGVILFIVFRRRNRSDECNYEPEAEMEPEMDFSMTIEMSSSCGDDFINPLSCDGPLDNSGGIFMNSPEEVEFV
jgi:hypothetical protein